MKVFRAEVWKDNWSSALRSATAEPSANHPDTHLLFPPQGGFPSGLDSVRGTRHHGLVERVHRDRNRINSPHRRPIDKHGRQISFHFYVSDSREASQCKSEVWRCRGLQALGLRCFPWFGLFLYGGLWRCWIVVGSCLVPSGADLVIMLI